MRPAKFDDDHEQVARRDAQMINGLRPSPLRINQNSHVIHKPSSSNSYVNHHHQHQQRNPVIIYTHSPKIIHTQARDFMALVQKLTGLTPSQHDSSTAAPPEHQKGGAKTFISSKPIRHDENESSSALTEENCGDHDGGASDYDKERTSSVSPMFNTHKPYLADLPLFTPRWNDFFCSPRPLFKYNGKVSPSRNMGNSMSPSVNLELMKGLQPEY